MQGNEVVRTGDISIPLEREFSSLLSLVALEEAELGPYLSLLSEAYTKGEFKALARSMLKSEIDAFGKARMLMQPSEAIVIARDRHKTISMSHVANSGRSVGDAPGSDAVGTIDVLANDVAIFVLGNGSIAVQGYTSDADGKRISERGEVTLLPGNFVCVERGTGAYEVRRSIGDIWVVQVVIGHYDHLIRHYDRHSKEMVGVSSASFHATRMEFAMELLVRCAPRRCSDLLCSVYAGSPFHFVRWKAIKCLALVDPDRARQMLHVAAEMDPHPHVREAAMKSVPAMFRDELRGIA